MRVKDIINEAISVTKYEKIVTDGLMDAVKASIGALANYRLTDELKATLSDDNVSHEPVRDYVEKAIERQLKREIEIVADHINRAIGDKIITNINVTTITSGANAYVSDRFIVVDIKPIKQIAARSTEAVMDILYDNYDSNQRAEGFYKATREIGDGDRYFWRHIFYKIEYIIESLASTLIHELVHVLQHWTQFKKGRRPEDYEYRSYLDKTKGEFRNIAGNKTQKSQRYYDLYMSSPQEIAAFAHEAALRIIKDYSLNEINDVDEFYAIDSESLVGYVDEYTSRRFKEPKTPKEQMVRKRYLKLVYQEIQSYIQNRIDTIKKTNSSI